MGGNYRVALITGATGFIGSHLAQRLIDDNWGVHLIVRPESNLYLLQNVLDKITLHQHNGSTGNMIAIVKTAKPSVVFHLASLFLAQHEEKDIEPLIKSNVLFAGQLVEAMVTSGVYSLINTGTSWQHFESKDYSPVCLYAATKQAFESIARFYVETTPLRIITLKLYDTYGPNDPRPKLFSLLRKIAEDQTLLAMSAGEQLVDLVYVDDVINAFVLAANRLQENETTNWEEFAVTSSNPIRLKELAEIYSQVTGKPLSIEWGGRPYRPREVMVPWSSGRCLPNWEPKISLWDGIKKMEGKRD